MFKKVLIANRGAIACRIIRTLRSMGVKSVAVYTEADALSRHVVEADEAYCIGSGVASESYLRADKILEIARQSGAQAIHPGYGFLSEKADFAEQCAVQGIYFIGPTPDQMRAFGLKHTARELAQQNRVPLLPGTGLLDSEEDALREAAHIGFARAWPAIRDGHLTMLISAVILFWLGTGIVQGFALVFGFGVVASLLTAVTVSRVFLLAILPEHAQGGWRNLMSSGFRFRTAPDTSIK